jgi:hypothetical protein
MFHFTVSYLHMRDYRVCRHFETVEQAEEFIHVNALVCPLPGLVREYEVRNDLNFAWVG